MQKRARTLATTKALSTILSLASILTATLGFVPQAFGGLGRSQDSVEQDRSVIRGVRHDSIAHEKYTVHEIAAGRVTVREYAANDGVIFCMTWKGSAYPDLSTGLLGSYFSEYESATKAQKKIRGRRSYGIVSGPNVVVEKYGHLRALGGRACLSQQIPAGVSADEIL